MEENLLSDESLKNADNYLIDCLWQNGRVVQIWMELLCQAVKWFSSVCRTLGEGSPNTSSLHQATFIYQIWKRPKSACTCIHHAGTICGTFVQRKSGLKFFVLFVFTFRDKLWQKCRKFGFSRQKRRKFGLPQQKCYNLWFLQEKCCF